jgi:hypothetical protein
MNLFKKLRTLMSSSSDLSTEKARSLVIMQRSAYSFSKSELQDAAQRGWGRKFDGKEDPMYFVAADHSALTVVKAGPHIIRVINASKRYSDDDKYALSQLPQPEQKRAWTEHHACVFLEFFNDFSSGSERIPDTEAYSSLARLALQLGDPNCAAVYVPIKNMMFPNDGIAEQGLRLLMKNELPLRR